MAIFKKPFYYDNSIVYVDTAWSTNAYPELNVKFAHGPFDMDYHGLQSTFVKHFKEDFTAFYEKVMHDYDEVTGRSNDFENCFDAMIEDMTEIDYRPWTKVINIDFKLENEEVEEVKDTEEQLRARFKAYENRIEYLEEMMAKELYKNGMSVKDISERLSMAESAVKYFVYEGE